MELEELKTAWEQLNKKVEQQQKLNEKLILQMTKQNYNNRINKIAYPESIATPFCFGMAIALIAWFDRLDTPLLRIAGIFCLLFLVVCPLLSLWSIRGLQKIDPGKSTYTEALKEFVAKKIYFQKIQTTTLYLAYPFMIAVSLVSIRIISEKDFTQKPLFWLILIPIGSVYFFLVTRWVLKHYNKALEQATAILSDVDV